MDEKKWVAGGSVDAQRFEGFGSESHLLWHVYPIDQAGDLPKLIWLPAGWHSGAHFSTTIAITGASYLFEAALGIGLFIQHKNYYFHAAYILENSRWLASQGGSLPDLI